MNTGLWRLEANKIGLNLIFFYFNAREKLTIILDKKVIIRIPTCKFIIIKFLQLQTTRNVLKCGEYNVYFVVRSYPACSRGQGQAFSYLNGLNN